MRQYLWLFFVLTIFILGACSNKNSSSFSQGQLKPNALTTSSANNVYFAQNPAGANSGADCADARKVSSLTSGDWVAGNVIHLCGTITSGFSVQGSGSAGNVITVRWESGARISVPYGQIIYIGSYSYLLFDGGSPCGPSTSCNTTEAANQTGYPSGTTGIIEATANGSALANQNTNTQAFYGGNGGHDIEIRNLIVRNLYVHSKMSDNALNADSGNFLFQCAGGNNGCSSGTISIHDNTIHDMGNAISLQKSNSITFNVFNNDMYHNNWAMENSGNGTRVVNIHDNHFHDAANWDTSTDTFHHNGLHNYMNVATDSIALNFYNNLSDGDWGGCCTTATQFFTEVSNPSNFNVYNNVAIQFAGNTAPPFEYGATGGIFANNTAIGTASTSSNVEGFAISGENIDFRNNATEGYGQYIVVGGGTTFTHCDYNIYGAIGLSGNSPWQYMTTGANAFSQWQAAGCDAHGSHPANLGVNPSGVPQIGSALALAGVNLTSLGIAALNSDTSDGNTRSPALRSTSGAWDAGAFLYSGSSSSPAPTPMPTPAPILTPSPTPVSGNWVFCADENAQCSFSGTYQVRFGANGQYFYKTFTNGTQCNDDVFGDPDVGVVKQCYYSASAPASGASTGAQFVKIDSSTEGSWIGNYGASGYALFQYSQSLPSYVSMSVTGQANWVWNPATSDVRGTQEPGSSTRIAASDYAVTSFTIDINLTDGQSHQVALYVIDWDGQGRAETLTVTDATSGSVLNSQSVSSFTSGKYVVWNIQGHVKIQVTTNAGPNGVVSGVFIK